MLTNEIVLNNNVQHDELSFSFCIKLYYLSVLTTIEDFHIRLSILIDVCRLITIKKQFTRLFISVFAS